MGDEIFFGRYRICRDPQGDPEEAGRAGAAITYRSVDENSNQPVVLQLVPLAAIDQIRRDEFEKRAKALCELDHVNVARTLAAGIEHDYVVFVTEYLRGETADAWLVAHGTMAVDAVLRVGIQVVRAIAAAAFHGLTHRAIQPSNIIILHGEAPSGGWPFIKLLNFGAAALEVHRESNEAQELAPAVMPQFASPEQVGNQQIDFRSEIYSLGATMCFLLTGAVPLPGVGDPKTTRPGRRRLPELRSMPKPVRRLLGVMLADNPEDRPLDPVVLERYMLTILDEAERRHAFARKVGIPLAAYVQRKVQSPSRVAQIVRGGLAAAALLMALGLVGAIFYPNYFHRTRTVKEIGVPVGVPITESKNGTPAAQPSILANNRSAARSTASPSVPPNTLPSQISRAPSTLLTRRNKSSRSTGPLGPAGSPTAPSSSSSFASRQEPSSPGTPKNQPAAAPNSTTPVTQIARSNRPSVSSSAGKGNNPATPTLSETDAVASRDSSRSPEPPAEQPDNGDTSATAQSESRAITQPKKKTDSDRQLATTPRTSRFALRNGRLTRAYFIGTTPRGNLLFRLPSGKIVATTPEYRQLPIAERPRIRHLPLERPNYFEPPPYGYPPPDRDY
jgi:serine/threonine-protein kinase